MAIQRAGEDNARDGGRSRRLRVIATRRPPHALRRGRRNLPDLLARRDLKCRNAGAALAGGPTNSVDRNLYRIEIGSDAPLYAAQSPSITKPGLPELFAAVVGIQAVHDS